MANDLKARPWVIDTAGAGVLYSNWVKIAKIVWIGCTDAGHTVVVTDKNARPLATLNGTTDLEEVESYELGWVNGLIVSTLGSGKLLVFIE